MAAVRRGIVLPCMSDISSTRVQGQCKCCFLLPHCCMGSACCDVTSEFLLALTFGAMDSCVLFSLVIGGHLDFSEQRVLLAVSACRGKPLHETLDLTPVLLKCAIVLSRSPAPIRTCLRVQNRGDYGALRVALMNYLDAEDDGHGPVPMEVGAMKGKKGDKGKKGYGKGKYGKSLEKYDKSNGYSKSNEHGKWVFFRKNSNFQPSREVLPLRPLFLFFLPLFFLIFLFLFFFLFLDLVFLFFLLLFF